MCIAGIVVRRVVCVAYIACLFLAISCNSVVFMLSRDGRNDLIWKLIITLFYCKLECFGGDIYNDC